MWHVVKVSTANGPRIGISQDPDGFEVLDTVESENAADHQCKQISRLLSIPEFSEADTMYIC